LISARSRPDRRRVETIVGRYLIGHLLVAVTFLGCGSPLRDLRLELARPLELPASARRVEMQYLGNGGWLIRRGGEVIATAPFVSNPGLLKVYLPSRPDLDAIDKLIPAMPDVEIMLVGHGHYDHAMDLPHILGQRAPDGTASSMRAKAPNAKLYGSKTVKHLLGPKLPGRVESVTEAESATGWKAPAKGLNRGPWIPSDDAAVRFMPLASTHAPHLFGFIKLVSWGHLQEDVASLPMAPFLWPEGETLAFLIDFLRPDKTVEFRIYYQDAASHPGTGIIPHLTGRDAAPVDVAILCVAGFSQVSGNPEHILSNVRPRHIIGGHWEDFFFWPDQKIIRSAPGTSIEGFVQRAQGVSSAPIYMVEPGTTLSFSLDGS
jgi:hypothetical protein